MAFDAQSQRRRFEQADDARSRWILQTPLVQQHEREVFACLEIGGGPVLELGAGEGLTLGFRPELAKLGYIGSDLHLARARSVLEVAREAGVSASSLSCNAAELPFSSGRLGTVLCRDLLHHLPSRDRRAAVAEVARVLRSDGQFSLIEPNAGRSPLVALFSAAIPTERLALGFHAESLRRMLEPHFHEVQIDHLEPSMLYRLVFHHRFGRPSLSSHRGWRTLVERWERFAERWVPPRHWTYLRARCRGPLMR